MEKYKVYLKYVLRHKFYVMRECFRRGLYWRGLVHDLDKFNPSRFHAYANKHYGGVVDANAIKPKYQRKWLTHQKGNQHHWQSWVMMDDYGHTIAVEMHDGAWKEMVCDWIGTSYSLGYKGLVDAREWYKKRRDFMLIAPETKKKIESYLEI